MLSFRSMRVLVLSLLLVGCGSADAPGSSFAAAGGSDAGSTPGSGGAIAAGGAAIGSGGAAAGAQGNGGATQDSGTNDAAPAPPDADGTCSDDTDCAAGWLCIQTSEPCNGATNCLGGQRTACARTCAHDSDCDSCCAPYEAPAGHHVQATDNCPRNLNACADAAFCKFVSLLTC